MASANVELVRALYSAWERGDYSSVEWAHPDIEFAIADGPSPGNWTGIAGMTEGFRGLLSSWEGWRSEAEEYLELDDERVLVLVRQHGRGKASGVDVGRLWTRGAGLYHVRDGRVTRIVLYFDRDRALADARHAE